MISRLLTWLRRFIQCLLDCLRHKCPPRPRRAKIGVSVEDLIVPSSGPKGPVNAGEFSLIGEFDVDWLLDAGFVRLLDNLAVSPGAFKTVRIMKALSSGSPERDGLAADDLKRNGVAFGRFD
jgi:hypothetical protein